MVIIEKGKKTKNGSIYYNKSRKNWRCTYYIYEKNSHSEIRKTKSFLTEQEAKEFLTSIQYQSMRREKTEVRFSPSRLQIPCKNHRQYRKFQ